MKNQYESVWLICTTLLSINIEIYPIFKIKNISLLILNWHQQIIIKLHNKFLTYSQSVKNNKDRGNDVDWITGSYTTVQPENGGNTKNEIWNIETIEQQAIRKSSIFNFDFLRYKLRRSNVRVIRMTKRWPVFSSKGYNLSVCKYILWNHLSFSFLFPTDEKPHKDASCYRSIAPTRDKEYFLRAVNWCRSILTDALQIFLEFLPDFACQMSSGRLRYMIREICFTRESFSFNSNVFDIFLYI